MGYLNYEQEVLLLDRCIENGEMEPFVIEFNNLIEKTSYSTIKIYSFMHDEDTKCEYRNEVLVHLFEKKRKRLKMIRKKHKYLNEKIDTRIPLAQFIKIATYRKIIDINKKKWPDIIDKIEKIILIEPDFVELLDKKYKKKKLRKAIKKLSSLKLRGKEPDKLLKRKIVIYRLKGLSNEEIGELLGIESSYVAVLYTRIVDEFKKILL